MLLRNHLRQLKEALSVDILPSDALSADSRDTGGRLDSLCIVTGLGATGKRDRAACLAG